MAIAWSRISSKVMTPPRLTDEVCRRRCAHGHGHMGVCIPYKADRRKREVLDVRHAALTDTRGDVARVRGPPSLGLHPHAMQEHTMSPHTRDATHHAKARRRRYRKAHERLARDRRQAQHAAETLQQALDDLGLPEDLVAEIEGRLRSQHKLLGKICGVMCPPLFGCRTNTELCRVRGWDKNLPSRLLGALPKRSWLKRLRRLGLEVLVPLWRYAASKSAATRSRWQWTWVGDDSVFKKYGEQLGLVGTWWSGQEHRVLSGIDGVLLVVVLGEGNVVVHVDFVIRRPDPTGPGAPCRDKLRWVQSMLDERLAAFRRRGVHLPPPIVVADSWFGDSKLMRHLARTHEGTLLVEGKTTYDFALPDGRQVTGHELPRPWDWLWREGPQVPGVRYVRLRATSPTYGAVTVTIVKEPSADQYYLAFPIYAFGVCSCSFLVHPL